MQKWTFIALLLLGATLLGATVLREPVAWAAQVVDARIAAPLDHNGNVAVHEQGTAAVQDVLSPSQHTASVVASAHQTGEVLTVTPTVPDGQIFIVETVGMQSVHLSRSGGDCLMALNLNTPDHGFGAALPVSLSPNGKLQGLAQVSIPVIAGRSLEVKCRVEPLDPSDPSSTSWEASATGYFVPAS